MRYIPDRGSVRILLSLALFVVLGAGHPSAGRAKDKPEMPDECAGDVRFVDRGLTVYDCQENLEWEKKSTGNVNQLFTWSTAAPWNFDGTAASYINSLNAVGFAGHKDWRLPMVAQNGGKAELETIMDLTQGNCGGGDGPCIDEFIFGPTAASDYWSSVTHAVSPGSAWLVNFGFGVFSSFSKRDS